MNTRTLASLLFVGLCASCQSAQTVPAPVSPATVPSAAAKPAPAAKPATKPAAKPAAGAEAAKTESDRPAAPAEFPADVRTLLRDLVEKDVTAALRESPIPATEAVVVRPFASDAEGYLRDLLKTAVSDSGRVCVEASDDMWEGIMKEIGWNQGFADILDARTMTVLGRLLPSRILLYGKLRVDRTAKGRPSVELSLHACDLETRRHLWGKTLSRPVKPSHGPVEPPPATVRFKTEASGAADLSVFLAAVPSDPASGALADELLSVARENIGARGFRIADKASDADVSVKLMVSQSAFDRTGESVVMEGAVRVLATVPARKDFYLAETRFDRERGERSLGDRDATLSVRDRVAPKLSSWLGENVTVEKTGLEAVRLVYDVSGLDEDATAKFISGFCGLVGGMNGVSACRLLSQTDDEAAFYVSFLPKVIPEGVINAGRVAHPELFDAVEAVR